MADGKLKWALAVLVCGVLTLRASPNMPPEVLKVFVKENWHRVITDADFFGSFTNGDWKQKPMLDYAFSPQLKKVEVAAKAGDYEQAASDLLRYFQTRDFNLWPKPTGWNKGRVELWKDNIFGFDQQEHLVTVCALPREPGFITLDIGQNLRRGTTAFELMGRHKNGVVSYVASRKSDTPPTLELQFKDGTTSSIKASADTYIRAGKFGKDNYGTVKTLEVCDSGLEVGKPFDDGTRRALIAFDLAAIDQMKVKQAKLRLKAWSSASGQELMLFHSVPTVVDEAKDTWATYIGYIYSWEGLPGGVDWWNPPKGAHGLFYNWVQRLIWFDGMAAMAVNTDDLEGEKTTMRLIRSFADSFPKQNRFNGDLDAGDRVKYFAHLLPYLFKIKACTPRDCVELLKFVVRDNTMLYLNESKLVRSNDDNMGMGLLASQVIGSVGFPELVDSKLWKDDAITRLPRLFDHLVLKDGAYCEHTFGYPFGVLGLMLDLLDLFKQTNLKAPESLPKKSRDLARYLMFNSFPDGTLPDWGEGTAKNSSAEAVRRAAKVFNDPELLWWVSQGKSGHEPAATTVSFPDAKIGVIRDSWKPDAKVLFISSRVGGGHYHVDQNALVLYAYGRNLLNDTGMSSYSGHHPAFDWQRHQTKSHNTVEVDEKGFPRLEKINKNFGWNQEGPCGSSVSMAAKATLFAGWAGGYLNVRHERRVLSLKENGIYFVADLLKPNDGKSHIYDQCWHIYPTISFKTEEQTCQVWTQDDKEANLEIMPLYPPKLQLLVRKGFNAQPLMDTKYPSFRQEVSGIAEFLTILAPSRPGMPTKSLKATLLATPPNVRGVEIFMATGRGVFLISYTHAPVKVDAIETDGSCAYVQFDEKGNVLWSVLAGGNMLKVEGRNLPFELMAPLAPPALPASVDSSKKAF
jgi:hypothetical protein